MANGTDRLRLGVLLRQGEMRDRSNRVIGWRELRDMAQAAEGIGFDTLWIADHLIFRNAGSIVMPEGEARGVWEAFTTLSALAEATSRATLGPFVSCNSFRNPALLAKIADTLDEVSGGRLLLGLGAGWHEPEYTAFGYPFDHLASRFDEALRIIVPLLKGEEVTFEGQYYRVKDCVLRPRGPRPGGPPIWIGAARPRMLRLVARYADAYNSVWHGSPAELDGPFANLDAACREVGRDPTTIRRTAGAFVAVPDAGEALGRAAERPARLGRGGRAGDLCVQDRARRQPHDVHHGPLDDRGDREVRPRRRSRPRPGRLRPEAEHPILPETRQDAGAGRPMTDVIRKHIEIVEGAGGPKARIAGHRIRVIDIAIMYEKLGLSADEIVDQLPTITLADVHAALAYYWDNRDELERKHAEGEAFVEVLRRTSPSLLEEKLKKLRGG